MGMMIEEQAVIDCLTNTAKYYDMPNADEWTKGIHYGLLHGLDNILDNVKSVDAIPKDQYESRLKADMTAMLTNIQQEIDGEACARECLDGPDKRIVEMEYVSKIIQQTINLLRGQ